MFGTVTSQKVWGMSCRIHCSADAIVCFADVLSGGYCSAHWHKARDNWFQVASGSLSIQVWDTEVDTGTVDHAGAWGTFDLGKPDSVTHLTPACGSFVVPCNKLHRFYTGEGCRMTEVYTASYSGSAEDEDIVRLSVGGRVDMEKVGSDWNGPA